MRPAKTQISLCIRAVWSDSSLIACAFYILQATQKEINENPCHTEWMYMLIWVWSYSRFCRALLKCFIKNKVVWICSEDISNIYELSAKRTFWHKRPTQTQIRIASAQNDQSLHCPHEQSLHPWLSTMRLWRFWSDCANVQADLNLRWTHMAEGTFSDVSAYVKLRREILIVTVW